MCRYLNALQTQAQHLLRYLAAAVVVNKRRRGALKELMRCIEQARLALLLLPLLSLRHVHQRLSWEACSWSVTRWNLWSAAGVRQRGQTACRGLPQARWRTRHAGERGESCRWQALTCIVPAS